jgi:hypothetical protein
LPRTLENVRSQRESRKIPMDIAGVTAVIVAELGFAPPLVPQPICFVTFGGRARERLVRRTN